MKILLKISGEALKGEKNFGIEDSFVEKLSKKIEKIVKKGIKLAIVIGGGNIYRGSKLIESGVNEADSHNLSMLSTVFNGVVLKNFLEKNGVKSQVFSPLGINFLENYNKDKAQKLLEDGVVTIFVGGTGNPYFTTDTGGVLRALEIGADFMIKATKVDGLYTKDPKKFKDAKFLEKISYDNFIENKYKIMDMTAVVLAKEGNLKIKIVNLNKETSILNALYGKDEGSEIS